jgi:hypothetical protein
MQLAEKSDAIRAPNLRSRSITSASICFRRIRRRSSAIACLRMNSAIRASSTLPPSEAGKGPAPGTGPSVLCLDAGAWDVRIQGNDRVTTWSRSSSSNLVQIQTTNRVVVPAAAVVVRARLFVRITMRRSIIVVILSCGPRAVTVVGVGVRPRGLVAWDWRKAGPLHLLLLHRRAGRRGLHLVRRRQPSQKRYKVRLQHASVRGLQRHHAAGSDHGETQADQHR